MAKAADWQIKRIKWLAWSRAQILALYCDVHTVSSEKANDVIAELEAIEQVRFSPREMRKAG